MVRSSFAVVAGDTPDGETRTLRRYFAHLILLPPDERITSPVSRHPDMNFAVIGGTLVTHAAYYRAAKKEIERICALGGFRLTLSFMERGAEYPHDIGFNALVLGGALIGNIKYLSPELVTLAAAMGMEPVSVRQGYTACSALVLPSVGEYGTLVCTADGGIAKVCGQRGAEVLRIPQDTGISLPGYDCGFIGGCCGVWGNTAFFFGNPALHPELVPLCDTMKRRGMRVVPLSEGMLTDRGGIRIFNVG